MKKIEIIGKRRPREKHFLQEDGSFIAEMYDEDIHYLNNGKYEEINSQLKLCDNYYVCDKNNFKMEFSAITGNELLKLLKNDIYINISLNKYNRFSINKYNESKKYYDKIKYINVLYGIDLQYEVIMSKIKESIIIKNKEAKINDLCFNIKTNANLVIGKNGSIEVIDKDNILFEFELPYLIDANNSINKNINYNLIKDNDTYQLLMNLDTKWLNSAEYPVIIDPTIKNYSSDNSLIDTYIYPGDTGISRSNLEYLKVGVENQNVINRSLIKFELPVLGTGSQVIKATLNLTDYPDLTDSYYYNNVDIHRITQSWQESTADWNSMNNKYDSRIDGALTCYRWYYINGGVITDLSSSATDITPLVQKWYTGTPNNGIMLIASDETFHNKPIAMFFSKNNTVTGLNPKPLLIIEYRNQTGLEDYMHYEKQILSRGAVYHNTYNGNMVHVLNIGNTINSKLPINLKLIYNTNNVILSENVGCGIGYRFNYNQTIQERQIDNKTYLEYVDEDGTLHYFINEKRTIVNGNINVETFENKFFDEDGLQIEIERTSTYYLLKYKNNSKKRFDINSGIGYLSKLIDSYNNEININYDSSNRIISLYDSSNQGILISYYDTPNQYINITNPDNTSVELHYSSNNLVRVDYNFSNDVESVFYSSQQNLIKSITDVNNKKFIYDYYEESPYKLKKVTEYGIENGQGKFYETYYGFGVTTLIDEKDNRRTIAYNSLGNPKSLSFNGIENSISNAYGIELKYGDDYSGWDGTKNKLLNQDFPISYVKNLLKDSSFESENNLFISDDYVEMRLVEAPVRTGIRCLRYGCPTETISSIYQAVDVEGDKYYTFSAYINTENWNAPVKLAIGYKDNNNVLHQEFSDSITCEEYERLSTSIFVPDNLTESKVYVSIIMDGMGRCYIDDVQLEEGLIANNYNIIENSDFSDGLTDWTFESEDTNRFPIADVFNVVTQNNQTALKVNMSTFNASSFRKEYNISGKMNEKFSLSFWFKNNGISGATDEIGSPIQNSVSIIFYPSDPEAPGGDSAIEIFNLNPCQDEWQFFKYDFVADYDFERIELIFTQLMNGNDLYITNINLFKDLPSVIYEYDANGNVIKAKKSNNQITNYKYDKNNNLISSLEPSGNVIYREYDNISYKKLISGIGDNGLKNELYYDQFNNVKYNRMINKNKSVNGINGLYRIRLKGSNKIIGMKNKTLFLYDDINYNYLWNFEKNVSDDYYKISHNIINNAYFTIDNNLLLTNYQNDKSLFELLKQDNGSFYIKNKDSSKYIKVDNNIVTYDDLDTEETEKYEFYLEDNQNEEFFESSAEYSEDGRFIKSVTGPGLDKSDYDFNQLTGLINARQTGKKQIISYEYTDTNQLEKIIDNKKIINYIYNDCGKLCRIEQGNRIYHLTYDEFLNLISIELNGTPLFINTIGQNNGNLISKTFNNNQTIGYEYDEFNRLYKLIKQNNDEYEFIYDKNGHLAIIKSNDEMVKYIYDLSNKIYEVRKNNFKVNFNYDVDNNIVKKQLKLFNNTNLINNNYTNGELTSIEFDNDTLNIINDLLGRTIEKNINNNIIRYNYYNNGNRATNRLKDLIIDNQKYTYKYDYIGNLTSVYYNNQLTDKYYYDEYNQLIREDNFNNNRTIRYYYDEYENLLYKKIFKINTYEQLECIKYTYGNNNWKDQLTNYNGQQITYDLAGNPISIGNSITLTWANGRELNQYIDNNSNTISFKYGYDGVRTSKIVNNVETIYYSLEDLLLYEKTNNSILYFLRDNNGDLIGFDYNQIRYYYIKNKSNDIIGIKDSNNNIVAKYSYDSWGKIISITDGNNIDVSSNASHIANINPYRYRSYYYDKETNLYYLINRYYNPTWGRFINADCVVGKDIYNQNLYSYCGNDPINKVDSKGSKFSLKKLVNKIVKTVKKVAKALVSAIIPQVKYNVATTEPTSSSGSPVFVYAETGNTTKTTISKSGSDESFLKGEVNYDPTNPLFGTSVDLNYGSSGYTISAQGYSSNLYLNLGSWCGTIKTGVDIKGVFVEFDSEYELNKRLTSGSYVKSGISYIAILAVALAVASTAEVGDPSVGVMTLEELLQDLSTVLPLNSPILELP